MQFSKQSSQMSAVHCSFCKRTQVQVRLLIKRGKAHVCNECVSQMKDLLAQSSHQHHSGCGCSQHKSQNEN